MAQTGKQRSLTVSISKTVAGVLQDGYPHIYQGRNTFTYNSINYPTISTTQLATMPVDIFDDRLASFMAYVEGIEVGLSFATDTVVGSEAYRVNTTACPIG